MKTLSNCKPREFMRQLSRIRESARAWMDLTQLQQLRRRMPPPMDYKDDGERFQAVMKQWRQNIQDMIDAALVKHPEETIEFLGLLCFIEPEDLDNHAMSELYEGFLDTLKNDKLVDLFTLVLSLMTPRKALTAAPEAADVAMTDVATAQELTSA